MFRPVLRNIQSLHFGRQFPFAARTENMPLLLRHFGSKRKKAGKIQKDQKKSKEVVASTEGFMLDNLAEIREKALAMEKLLKDPKVSKALLKCETSTDFLAFAEANKAKISGTNRSHVKVSLNGVITGFQSSKVRFRPYVRKQKIEAFKAMGIAWEENPVVGPQSIDEQIRDLLLEEGDISLSNISQKFVKKYGKAESDIFKQGQVLGSLQRLADKSGLFVVEDRSGGGGHWLVLKKK